MKNIIEMIIIILEVVVDSKNVVSRLNQLEQAAV